MPDIFTKLICSFIENRHAHIKINNHTGEPISLRSGVPQGSSLSPTLYTLFTSDIPQPSPGCSYIIYADDITQIISYPGKSRQFMARKIQREIIKINNYEKKWKIKTNTTKFQVIPLAVQYTEPIYIENSLIPFSKEGKILGLKFNQRGLQNQVTNMQNKANIALKNIGRFHGLTTKIKLHLVKACVIPVLTFPAYPLNALTKTATLKLQIIQNKALRFALEAKYPYTKTTEQLHHNAHIKPLNIIYHERGNTIKNKIINELKIHEYQNIISEEIPKEHGWFKRPISYINKNTPAPIYNRTSLY